MRKKIRLFFMAVMMIACMGAGAISVSAQEDIQTVDGSRLTQESFAQEIAYPTLRGKYFGNGGGGITLTGNRTVLLTGNTVARQTVDSVKVTMHLQQLKNGSWVTIASYGPVTKSNTYYVSASRSYSVAGGYYYRMTGSHTVIENGVFESAASATDGIWVS